MYSSNMSHSGVYLKDSFEIGSMFMKDERFFILTEQTLYQYANEKTFNQNKVPDNIFNLNCYKIERFKSNVIMFKHQNIPKEILMLFSKDSDKINLWFHAFMKYKANYTKFQLQLLTEDQTLMSFRESSFINAQEFMMQQQQKQFQDESVISRYE